MLCAVMMAQAQINEGLHWYNGQITFTARNIENKNVLMEAMDEGEEHEFVLRYVKEVNKNHQVYRTDNGTHDYVNLYGVGSTMRHKKAEGLDVLCFYDDKDCLAAVISGEKEWDAEKLNKSRWLSQYIGEYTTEEENEVEQCFNWTWESLSFNGIIYPYDIITFNGRVTGYITIKPVEGSTNELEGTWEIVPTLRGFRLYSVNTEAGNTPWEWQRTGIEYDLIESDPNVGRFFYASTTPAPRCLTTISSVASINPRSASCVTPSLPVTATVSSRRICRSILPTNLGTSLPPRMTASACRSLNSSTSNSSNKWRERNEKDHNDDICPCGNYILLNLSDYAE